MFIHRRITLGMGGKSLRLGLSLSSIVCAPPSCQVGFVTVSLWPTECLMHNCCFKCSLPYSLSYLNFRLTTWFEALGDVAVAGSFFPPYLLYLFGYHHANVPRSPTACESFATGGKKGWQTITNQCIYTKTGTLIEQCQSWCVYACFYNIIWFMVLQKRHLGLSNFNNVLYNYPSVCPNRSCI